MAEKAALIGRIAILPQDLANRIAAGEVIERPASVVKELMENSIDAGSTRIEVDVKAGGRLLIRVQDDGVGMDRQDALLAFERHATSKIRTDQDLLSIQTLGFRGEALPSISAVSKIRMVTVPRGDQLSGVSPGSAGTGRMEEGRRGISSGTEIYLEGGQVIKVQEAGAPPGTLAEVREIFYNTPARLKFLKATATELGHITRLVQQQALAHPGISFRLTHEGKQLLDLPAVGDRMLRIQQVYGRSFTEHLIGLESEWAGVKIGGAISKPPHTKGTRSYQELFVNHRSISSPLLLHAVYEAYDTALMKGQHPIVILFLELDGQTLDVNVHPTKREVRFRDQRLVYDLVKECVKTGLQKALSPTPIFSAERIKEAAEIYLTTHPAGSGVREREAPAGRPPAGRAGTDWDVPLPQLEGLKMDSTLSSSGEDPRLTEVLEEILPLGQVYDTYIIARIHGELWIIDQHAAHERVLYEMYLKAIQGVQVPVQQLLIPQTLELSMAQMMVLKGKLSQLGSWGLELEPFGPQSVVVRAVPVFLSRADLQGLLADLMEDWTDLEKLPSPEDRQKTLVATLACHGAIKANEALTVPEMEALLKDVLRLPLAATCPHGRPLRMKFTRKELETMFRR